MASSIHQALLTGMKRVMSMDASGDRASMDGGRSAGPTPEGSLHGSNQAGSYTRLLVGSA